MRRDKSNEGRHKSSEGRRDQQDQYSADSHKKSAAAQAAERLHITTIATLDPRPFTTSRDRGPSPFTVLP